MWPHLVGSTKLVRSSSNYRGLFGHPMNNHITKLYDLKGSLWDWNASALYYIFLNLAYWESKLDNIKVDISITGS